MGVRELVENSFPGDEPVLVRESGTIRVARIGELVEREIAAGGALEVNRRWYKHLDNSLEVLTLDEGLKLAFRRVTAVFKHPSPPKLWEITLQSGKTVRTTSVHNVFVTDDELKVVGKETRHLRPGDRVVVPAAGFTAGSQTEIDLLAELCRLEPSSVGQVVVRGAAQLYPVSHPPSQQLLLAVSGGATTRRDLHATAQDLGFEKPDNLIYTLRRKGALASEGRGEYKLRRNTRFKHAYSVPKDWVRCDAVPLQFLQSNRPPGLDGADVRFSVKWGRGALPRRIRVSPELMRVLGYYTSEGSVHAGYKVSFSFGIHEKDTYVRDLVRCLETAFDVTPSVTVEHGTAVNVVVNDSMLGLFIEKVLEAGSRSSDKRVPWIVFNVRREAAEEYLKAYIRGDGHVQTAKRNRKITLATSSGLLFTDLKFLLTLLGRHYTTAFQGASERTVKGVKTRFMGNHLIYIRQGKSPEALSIPIAPFRGQLAPLSQRKSNIYNQAVQKKWLQENFSAEQLPENLRRFVYSDAGTLSVRRTREYASHETWVYDIAVEGVERFIGGGAVALLHNSLDAAELAGILPDVYVRIVPEDAAAENAEPRAYRLTVADNGPGVDPHQVPRAFGKVFYGSKYVLRQSRGMFGLGGTMAILYGQITTNKPVRITTSTDGKARHIFEMLIDISENKPIILRKDTEDAAGKTGTRVDVIMEGDFTRSAQKINEYFKQTALVGSYADLTFVDPIGRISTYERATESMPPPPKETLPHPYGVDVEAFKRMIKLTEEKTMVNFMGNKHFHRVGDTIAKKFLTFAGIEWKLAPEKLTNEQIVKIVEALLRFPDFLPPDASCLSPVGEDILQTGIIKELQPEFSTVVPRPPSSYSGFPFLIEVGLVYGGKVLDPGRKLLRFANRIPLLYDESSDVSFKVINEEIDWRRYHVPDEAPIAVITHICSTKVPYKTVGKEYIADRPEIESEVRNAVREALRRLSLFLSKKGSMEAVQRKMNIYTKYLPLIARFSTELAELKRQPKYKQLLREEEEEVQEIKEEMEVKAGAGEAGDQTIEQTTIEDYS